MENLHKMPQMPQLTDTKKNVIECTQISVADATLATAIHLIQCSPRSRLLLTVQYDVSVLSEFKRKSSKSLIIIKIGSIIHWHPPI
jgi:hypothetical protein